MLYFVAVLSKPTTKQKEDGVRQVIILPPTAVVADNEQGAILAAAITAKIEDTSSVEVLVRPF